MARVDELRLMVKIARLYYERRLRQAEIADMLDLSQASISRMLRRAETEQIVRIKVSVPLGAYPDLEDAIATMYGLKQVIVVDSVEDEDQIIRDLGAAGAFYLESTLRQDEVVGISSWSATLLAMVNAMHSLTRQTAAQVVQILGGVGNPAAEQHAAQLTRRLAMLTHGDAVYLPAPGIVGSAETGRVFMEDQFVRNAMSQFGRVTLALVGIGTVEPSRLLASSGNVFTKEEGAQLQELGAVGDVCLRFFDRAGKPVLTPLNDRVIGMQLKQLRKVKRCVGIAGGVRKTEAILGALAGKWINVLITDRFTAERLTSQQTPRASPVSAGTDDGRNKQ